MFWRKLIAAALFALLVIAASGMLGTAPSLTNTIAATAQGHSANLRCEIEVEDFGASVQLQGIFVSGQAAHGAYDMLVSAPGSSIEAAIRQQGDFAAAANRPARLGIVELRKDSGGYHARLTIIWNGMEYRCDKRIGEAWT